MKKYLLILLLVPSFCFAAFDADVEVGAVDCQYNDIKIPGDSGTEYSFCDDLDYSAQPYYRMHLGYRFNQKHYAFITAAPFTVKAEGTLSDSLVFSDQTFESGDKITSYYCFNSWRVSWRYTLIDNKKWNFALGLTAKIRDAYISIETDEKEEKFSNVGFVPIIHFYLDHKLNEHLGINLIGDALGAPQGRAVDFRLSTYYQINQNYSLDLGYRLLEGGADNDRIYGFALFHYFSIALKYQF